MRCLCSQINRGDASSLRLGVRPLRVREPAADGIIWSQTKDLCEMVTHAVDPAVDGAHRDMLTGGNFLVAQALHTNQQEDLALPRW